MSSLFESLFGTTTFPYMMTSILSIKFTDWKWNNKNVVGGFFSDVFNSNGRLENNKVLQGNQKLPECLNRSVLSVSWWFYTCTLMFRFLSMFLIAVRINYTVIILRLNSVLNIAPLPYTIPRRIDNIADTYALFVTLQKNNKCALFHPVLFFDCLQFQKIIHVDLTDQISTAIIV